MKHISLILILFICSYFSGFGQINKLSSKKNNFYIQINHHLEKRGSKKYTNSNPDFAISYERLLMNYGDHNFYIGLRTGSYKEYVLTGYGWLHPEKERFFFGVSPSYSMDISSHLRFQINLLLDVLFPDDFDETWWYFGFEPSMQYNFGNFYFSLSVAKGIFIFFDPKAYIDKAGIKIGMSF
jgi:hypothetical protein